MKKIFLLLIYIFLLIGCSKETDETQKPERLTSITTTQSQFMTFNDVESALGTIEGIIDPTVAAEINGQVTKLYARTGSVVKKGDLLAEIDSKDYQYQKNLAEAEIRKLEARYLNQEKTYERNLALVEKNFISSNALDSIVTEKAETKEELQIAKSKLDIAQSNLSKTKIYSPINGKVQIQIASIGDYLKIGDGIFKVIGNKKVRVHIPFPEYLASKIKPGTPITLESAVSDKVISSTISELKPSLSEDSRSIDVIADIENEPAWQPGATVKGTILFGTRKNIGIPEQSVVQRPAGNVAYIIQNDVAKAQTVKTGIIQKGYVEILDGLTADQTIAVDGASFLTNDAKVNIKKE